MKKDNNEQIDIQKLIKEKGIKSIKDLDILFGQIKKSFIESALEEEFNQHMGYEKYDQNSRNVSSNYRKGKTRKTVSTDNGKITIEVPRDNDATFQPQVVKKHERNISRIEDQILMFYSKGMSTREIQDMIYQLFYLDLDKDTISRITDRIIPEIIEWQQRPLDELYPIIYVDGIRFKVRENSAYIEKSVYVILGIKESGYKEILGFWVSESESAKQWLNIFNELKTRGVKEILLACCDNLKGLSEAFKASFPDVKIQKCVIHQIRNSLRYVSPSDSNEFTSDMKKIYKSTSYDNALKALDDFDKKWSDKYSYAIKSWRNNFEELTTFFEFPNEIRKMIYTTNVIENLNRNIRKITKTKSGFTNTQSLTKLIYLKMKDIENSWNGRSISNWTLVMNQLRILFPDKFVV